MENQDFNQESQPEFQETGFSLRKYKWALLAVGICIFLVLALVVWASMDYASKIEKEKGEVETDTVSQQDEEAQGVDTSGWETYRNEEHDFQFKYPPDTVITTDLNKHESEISITFPDLPLTFYKRKPEHYRTRYVGDSTIIYDQEKQAWFNVAEKIDGDTETTRDGYLCSNDEWINLPVGNETGAIFPADNYAVSGDDYVVISQENALYLFALITDSNYKVDYDKDLFNKSKIKTAKDIIHSFELISSDSILTDC